jgi:hypothetical protein
MVASSNFHPEFFWFSANISYSRARHQAKISPLGLRFLWNGIVSRRNLAANAKNKR